MLKLIPAKALLSCIALCMIGCSERAVQSAAPGRGMTIEEMSGGMSGGMSGDTSETTSGAVGEGAGEGTGDLAGDRSPTTIEIELPMIPRVAMSKQLILTPDQLRVDEDTIQTYVLSSDLSMVNYEGYPNAYELSYSSPILVGCGALSETVQWVEATGEGVSAQVSDRDTIMINDWSPGMSHFTLVGIYHPSDDDLINCQGILNADVTTRVELTYEISAQAPTQIAPRETCDEGTEEVLIADSALTQVLGVKLLNAQSEIMNAHNAEYTHLVNLLVSAPEGTVVATPEQGLSGLHLGPQGGALRLSAPFGEPLEYSIINTQEVTGWSVAWSIAGAAGGGIRALEDGAVYNGPWQRTSNRILPVMTGQLKRGEREICDYELNPKWFIVLSETPEICAVDEVFYDSSEIGGEAVGRSVKLISDGECRLSLSAPQFNGDQGLIETLSVTVNRVDDMIDL